MQTHNFQNQSSARFLENYPVGARFLEPQNNSTALETGTKAQLRPCLVGEKISTVPATSNLRTHA